ncbi:MAG TPA: GNAT family N-acetyltransferase [Nocardioidaceae bacterium]|jgi:RimJ/RimL family protein N-acetyltransferase|nr:GNAT family N-acetyltransferase [Nocardioidaceae bacterium]
MSSFAMSFPRDVPTLTDGVVRLRAHTPEDVDALYEQATDSVMLRWTTVPDPSTRETAREFATHVIPDGWRSDREWAFAVDAPDADGVPRFVGTVSLRNEGAGRAEVAYGAHPWARGRGYVVRALHLLLAWGFDQRGVHTVIWWANKGNWASRKVAWRLGFSFDGTVREWLPQRGTLYDGWVGALTSTDARRPRTPWFDVPRIRGERVVLRELGEDDVPRVVEACSDERTSYWLTQLPAPYTEQDALAWIEQMREQHATGSGIMWAVADPDDDRMLGVVTAFDLNAEGTAEVGYWAHQDARGRGVTTEACALAVRHCFVPVEDGGLGLRRLRAFAAEGNEASMRVLKSNGFVQTGRFREGKQMRDGSYLDLVHFDLLVSEFVPQP